jgi:GNAT superfamily N-acetyltransferase
VSARVVDGIDGSWLEELFREDPAAHALAVWDRSAWPDAIEFRTLEEGGRPTAYLLFWHGLAGCPVVHWGGRAADPAPLLAAFPPRPFLAVVPPEIGPRLARARAPSVSYALRLRSRFAPPPPPDPTRPTRRLRGADHPALRAIAEQDRSSVTDTYLALELERDWVVGGFVDGRLVAAARAEVRLPRVWHVSGVYTAPVARGAGWGTAVVAHLLRDAAETGAGAGLFVREDNSAARAVYDRLGFTAGSPRVWVDAGARRPP